jgi:hypothetical protein
VVYWNYTETQNHGDLRLYIIVQFLPMLFIPLILLFFKSGFLKPVYIWTILFSYGLSKIAEGFDQPIFTTFKFISGHSIKHLFAAMAPLIFIAGIYVQKKQQEIPDKNITRDQN